MRSLHQPQHFMCYFAQTQGYSCTRQCVDLDKAFMKKRRVANPLGGDLIRQPVGSKKSVGREMIDWELGLN
jgi:hypothetical protein